MAEELYHLIIVDDDEYVRWSLSKYCDWAQLGFSVAATLEDGSDAVAYMPASQRTAMSSLPATKLRSTTKPVTFRHGTTGNSSGSTLTRGYPV